MLAFASRIGKRVLAVISRIMHKARFLYEVVTTIAAEPVSLSAIAQQMEHIGIQSLFLACATCLCAGAVMAMQACIAFARFGSTDMVGPVVATTLIRELGPILTGIMVTGRAGSAIAAEIASMSINEQVDALRTLAINPVKFLVLPRILAAIYIMPILTMFAVFAGIGGGFVVMQYALDLNGWRYLYTIKETTTLHEILICLVKAAVFGICFSVIACYQGINARGGALQIAHATTRTMVQASMTIFIVNYLITMMAFTL